MKRLVLLLMLLAAQAPAAPATKVLFIGNSYTAQSRENLNQILKSSSYKKKAEFHYITKGGATLKRHLSDEATIKTVADGNWNYVVLQEQSQLPGLGGKSGEWFQESVDKFTALIREAGAEPVLFVTWGRRDGDSANKSLYPDYQTMQGKLTKAYEKAAKRNDIKLAHVGNAWGIVRAKNAELGQQLYKKDGSHPATKGAYLAGSVIFESLFPGAIAGVKFQGDLNKNEHQLVKEAVMSASKTKFK